MFNYIIRGAGYKAITVKSDLNFLEFKEEIRRMTKLIHPQGTDHVLTFMGVELVNPKVMMMSDFVEDMPFLFGMK